MKSVHKREQEIKIAKGDFILLGKMLGITRYAARMRYYRGNEEAIKGLRKIIDSRNALINESE